MQFQNQLRTLSLLVENNVPTLFLLIGGATHSPSHLPLHPPPVIHALTGSPHHPPYSPGVLQPVQTEALTHHPVNKVHSQFIYLNTGSPTSSHRSEQHHYLICT